MVRSDIIMPENSLDAEYPDYRARYYCVKIVVGQNHTAKQEQSGCLISLASENSLETDFKGIIMKGIDMPKQSDTGYDDSANHRRLKSDINFPGDGIEFDETTEKLCVDTAKKYSDGLLAGE